MSGANNQSLHHPHPHHHHSPLSLISPPQTSSQLPMAFPTNISSTHQHFESSSPSSSSFAQAQSLISQFLASSYSSFFGNTNSNKDSKSVASSHFFSPPPPSPLQLNGLKMFAHLPPLFTAALSSTPTPSSSHQSKQHSPANNRETTNEDDSMRLYNGMSNLELEKNLIYQLVHIK